MPINKITVNPKNRSKNTIAIGDRQFAIRLRRYTTLYPSPNKTVDKLLKNMLIKNTFKVVINVNPYFFIKI